ncbi:MAG: ATP-dependent sacrificial sulfur transferase LarE [Phycisphaerae bacterium]|nr:ATP-dependent sacrificial sulfur transferase LarE [Phycisphaerae bacterium]
MTTTVAIDKKLEHFREVIARYDRVLVAFSGGVDSTFVLKVALDVLGRDRVLAVTADSPSVPRHELKEARELAAQIGADHLVIETHELDDPRYIKNPPDRCYFCRIDLYSKLTQLAEERGYGAVLTGANADDLGDFRPGMKAAVAYGIGNPCADVGMTKADIRRLSEDFGLPTHDKPANPCLSTRIAYGIPITRETLSQIEQAEAYLRQFGLREFRLRHHGDLARIEVPADRVLEFAEPVRREEVVRALRELGYKYVTLDLQGFRSGSMNDVIDKG